MKNQENFNSLVKRQSKEAKAKRIKIMATVKMF